MWNKRAGGAWWAFAIVACCARGGFADVKAEVQDATVTARIETTFLLNEHLSPFNINTSTADGVVTLTGSVREDIQKDLAENLARSVEGVKDVTNNITVVPTAIVEREKRGWRQKIEDQTVTASVQSRLLYHGQFKGLKISVVTINGVVTLSGVVGTDEQLRRIGEVAFETRGVEDVVNNLTVRPKDQLDQVENVGRQVSDEWVEKRVETAITFNRHLSVRQVQVEVDDGVCILTGTVDSEPEKALATTIAESMQGVREVRNDIRVRTQGAQTLTPIETDDESAPGPAAPGEAPKVESTPLDP